MKVDFSEIGFSSVKSEKEEKEIVTLALRNKTAMEFHDMEDKKKEVETYCEFMPGTGLIVRGVKDQGKHRTTVKRYYPVHVSKNVTLCGLLVIRPGMIDEEEYTGEVFSPISQNIMTFFIQNRFIDSKETTYFRHNLYSVRLSGMAKTGKIILPSTEAAYKKELVARETQAGTDGNSFSSQEMFKNKRGTDSKLEMVQYDKRVKNTEEKYRERIKTENAYSVIDTMLNSLVGEFDTYYQENAYEIIGKILEINEQENSITGEQVYIFRVSCTEFDYNIDICINKNKLVGEPEIGRRFVGKISLQGWIDWRE